MRCRAGWQPAADCKSAFGQESRRQMTPATRRKFLQTTAWSGVAMAQTGPATTTTVPPERRVYLVGDGVTLSPPEYARLLTKIVDERGVKADTYLEGGAV